MKSANDVATVTLDSQVSRVAVARPAIAMSQEVLVTSVTRKRANAIAD